MDDADRFIAVMQQVAGRRLTYKELIGNEGETAEALSTGGSRDEDSGFGFGPRFED